MGQAARVVDISGSPATAERLLAAAEALVCEEGLHAVRTRGVAARAGLNMGMIRYCFGGVDGLIRELMMRNLARFGARQKALAAEAGEDQRAILTALLAPLEEPAAFTPGAHAANVLQEILTHASDAVKKAASDRLDESFKPLLERLAATCPHLSRETMLWRFCCVIGGGLSLSPRAPSWQLYETLSGATPMTGERGVRELIAVAAAALAAPAVE